MDTNTHHPDSPARPHRAKRLLDGAIQVSLAGLSLAAIGLALYAWHSNRLTPAETIVLPLRGDMKLGGAIDGDRLARTLQTVCRFEQTQTVILQLDSPGGAQGIADRAVEVLDTECQGKRVIAVVENLCASACFAVAVAADEIVASRGSAVGGVGTIMRWHDYTGALEAAGVRERAIVSGPLKGSMTDAGNLTEGQQADLQALVDELGAEFVDEVRARRGDRLDASAPIQDGGLFPARRATALGLIDRVGTLEGVLGELATDGEVHFAPASRVGYPGPAGEGRGERLAREAIEKARQVVSP